MFQVWRLMPTRSGLAQWQVNGSCSVLRSPASKADTTKLSDAPGKLKQRQLGVLKGIEHARKVVTRRP